MAGFHEPRIGLVEPGDLNRCVRVAKAQNSGPQAGWDHELYGALPGINQRGCDARACSTDRQGSGSLWESKPAPAIPTLVQGAAGTDRRNVEGNCEDPWISFDASGRFHVIAHCCRDLGG